MAEVVSFEGYRPPARYDAIPWTQVRIQESPTLDGTYALLETKTLSPPDPDPAHPASRSFTTELGTALDYWYRVVFVDGTGDISQPTTPVQNVAGGDATPTSVSYAPLSELARILQIPAPTVPQQAAMQRALDAAAAEIDWELGGPLTYVPALVVEVNLQRAVEHWKMEQSPFGLVLVGGEGPTWASGTWRRHAQILLPLKSTWGVA